MSDEPFATRVRNALTGRGRRSDVLVIGLGRFGSTLAGELESMGHHVLGVDIRPEIVLRHRDLLSEVVEADSTTEHALRQLGAAEFETAVVTIGASVERSVLTTLALVDVGVPNLWARATTAAHATILNRVGAGHVVQPDRDEALRVAHRVVSGRVLDFLSLDDSFALVEMSAPAELVGRTLADAGLRDRYGVAVVCVKPRGSVFTYAEAGTVVGADDVLVVAGPPDAAERFAALPGPGSPAESHGNRPR